LTICHKMSSLVLRLLLGLLVLSIPATGADNGFNLSDDLKATNASNLTNISGSRNASNLVDASISDQSALQRSLDDGIPDSISKQLDNTSSNQTTFEAASPSDLLKYGNLLAGYGYYNFSLRYYNRSLDLDPGMAEAWNNKGASMALLGWPGSAVECYDRAIALEPENSIILSNKGEALHRLGQNAQALALLDRALGLSPKNADAWNDKGVILAGMGRYFEAMDCFNSSIASDLYYAKAYNNKGVVLAKMGRLDEGLTTMRSAAIILNENYPIAWYNGGLAQRDMGNMPKYDEAMERAEALGYNVTLNSTFTSSSSGDYVLDSEPAFLGMNEAQKNGVPGFEGMIAFGSVLFVAAHLARRFRPS
jgi:tetratricopeptide (TPR) repeat protein